MDLSTLTDRDVEFFSLNGLKTNGKVVNVYDGDTIHVVIPLHNTLYKFKARINGIDTPEMKPQKNCENRDNIITCAIVARNTVVSLVTNCDIDINIPYTKKELNNILKKNTMIVDMEFFEFDKYGRCLVDIKCGKNAKLSETMIMRGLANSYCGGTKKVDFAAYAAK